MNASRGIATITKPIPTANLFFARHHRVTAMAAIASKAPRDWEPSAAAAHRIIDAVAVQSK